MIVWKCRYSLSGICCAADRVGGDGFGRRGSRTPAWPPGAGGGPGNVGASDRRRSAAKQRRSRAKLCRHGRTSSSIPNGNGSCASMAAVCARCNAYGNRGIRALAQAEPASAGRRGWLHELDGGDQPTHAVLGARGPKVHADCLASAIKATELEANSWGEDDKVQDGRQGPAADHPPGSRRGQHCRSGARSSSIDAEPGEKQGRSADEEGGRG